MKLKDQINFIIYLLNSSMSSMLSLINNLRLTLCKNTNIFDLELPEPNSNLLDIKTAQELNLKEENQLSTELNISKNADELKSSGFSKVKTSDDLISEKNDVVIYTNMDVDKLKKEIDYFISSKAGSNSLAEPKKDGAAATPDKSTKPTDPNAVKGNPKEGTDKTTAPPQDPEVTKKIEECKKDCEKNKGEPKPPAAAPPKTQEPTNNKPQSTPPQKTPTTPQKTPTTPPKDNQNQAKPTPPPKTPTSKLISESPLNMKSNNELNEISNNKNELLGFGKKEPKEDEDKIETDASKIVLRVVTFTVAEQASNVDTSKNEHPKTIRVTTNSGEISKPTNEIQEDDNEDSFEKILRTAKIDSTKNNKDVDPKDNSNKLENVSPSKEDNKDFMESSDKEKEELQKYKKEIEKLQEENKNIENEYKENLKKQKEELNQKKNEVEEKYKAKLEDGQKKLQEKEAKTDEKIKEEEAKIQAEAEKLKVERDLKKKEDDMKNKLEVTKKKHEENIKKQEDQRRKQEDQFKKDIEKIKMEQQKKQMEAEFQIKKEKEEQARKQKEEEEKLKKEKEERKNNLQNEKGKSNDEKKKKEDDKQKEQEKKKQEEKKKEDEKKQEEEKKEQEKKKKEIEKENNTEKNRDISVEIEKENKEKEKEKIEQENLEKQLNERKKQQENLEKENEKKMKKFEKNIDESSNKEDKKNEKMEVPKIIINKNEENKNQNPKILKIENGKYKKKVKLNEKKDVGLSDIFNMLKGKSPNKNELKENEPIYVKGQFKNDLESDKGNFKFWGYVQDIVNQ